MSYRFGPFRIDPTAYRLFRGPQPVDLSPRAFDLLLLFVSRPGVLLTKDAIFEELWSDVTVTDNALTQVISELRETLGDSHVNAQFIQTVPRRGYRFIGQVDATSTVPATGPMAARRTPAATPAVRTVVVMNFANVTADPDLAWLSAGIAETVTNSLRVVQGVSILDRTLVSNADAGVLVDLAITGSFQRAGDQLRITARVIDTRSREVLANAKADGGLADVFDLQDAIVTQLSAGLELGVGGTQLRSRARETSDLQAYRAATEAKLRLEALDPAEIPAAIDGFERALAIDPRYALAHVGLAHARFWLFQASRAAVRPAVDELAGAIQHARQAIELDPELAEAYSALAFFLASADQSADAIAAGRRAIAIEPGNWRHQFRLGMAAWGSERLTCLHAVIAQFPQLAYAHFGIAMVHVARSDLTRAEQVLTGALALPTSKAAERFPASGLHWLLGLVRLADDDAVGARGAFDAELAARGSPLFANEYATDALVGHGLALLAGH